MKQFLSILFVFFSTIIFAQKNEREIITIDLTEKENSALNNGYKSISQILLDALEDGKIVGYDIKYNKSIESKILTQKDYEERIGQIIPPDTVCESCWDKYGWKFYTEDSIEIIWSNSDTDFKESLFPSDLSIIELDISTLNDKTQIHYIHLYTNPKNKNTITKEKRYVISFLYEDAQKIFRTDNRAVWHNLYNADFKKVSIIGDVFWYNDEHVGSKNLFDELVKLALSEEINCYNKEVKLTSDSLASLLEHIKYSSINPWSLYVTFPNSQTVDFYLTTNENDISTQYLISFNLDQYKAKKRNYYLPKDEVNFMNISDALLFGNYKLSQRKKVTIKSDFVQSKPINDIQDSFLYFPIEQVLYVNDSANNILKSNNYEIIRVLLETTLRKDSVFKSTIAYSYKNFEAIIRKKTRKEILKLLTEYEIIEFTDSIKWNYNNLKYLDIISCKGNITMKADISEYKYSLESIKFNISPIHPLNQDRLIISLFDISYDKIVEILKNDSRTTSNSELFESNRLVFFPTLTDEIMKMP